MLHRTKKILLIALSCWVTLNVSLAQTIDADSLFKKAQDFAFSANNELNSELKKMKFDDARRTCRELLSLYPRYFDADLLIGKTYVWEEKPDLARMTLVPLLNRQPNNYELLTLLIDNAIEDKKYDEAGSYIERALIYYSKDTEILYRKANNLSLRGEKTASLEVIDQILAIDPNNAGALDLKEFIDTSVGNLYLQAKSEVDSVQYEQARKTLHKILSEDPENFDASLLMAHIHGWYGRYDSARLITQQLVKVNPFNNDLLNVMMNVEIWSKNYKPALLLVNKALEVYPTDQNFLFQKAKIQYEMQDYRDALKSLDTLFYRYQNHENGKKLDTLIKTVHLYKNYVFLENYFESAKKPFLSRKMVQSIGLSKWEKSGTYIAKVNIGSDLTTPTSIGKAFQYELEAYPKLTSTNYLYLDYAYSGYIKNLEKWFFPNHRTALEFFQRLPEGFEVSLGFRTIYWTSLTWIFTGSVSWMNDNHYVAFRPYFNSTNSNSSYNLIYRYYFAPERDAPEREDYIYVLAGFGSYSDEFLHLNPKPGNSYMAQLGIIKFINPRWNLQASLGYGYDDRFLCMAGVRYYFNKFR